MSNKIHEFDPVIYPTRIWVGVKVPFKDISGKFSSLLSDGSLGEFEETEEKQGATPVATCYPVMDKESGWRGLFCHIIRPKDAGYGVVAHEAEHITCWICEQMGIDSVAFDDSEPRGYIIQFIADRIGMVKDNKIKNKS